MRPPRLPIPASPARHETVASYLSRLARLHGMHPRELWEPISSPRVGTRRRTIHADALAAATGRPVRHLMMALPELREPAPDWAAWRHQSQPRCPRCDARHEAGPPQRLLPHHRYICTRHRYWIGPPDAGQPATELHPEGSELDEIVRAQRRHLRLVRRFGAAAAFDAVLTGFLICGHLWADHINGWDRLAHRWDVRAAVLIPHAEAHTRFSASRVFAAVYPEAVDLAAVIAAPSWRRLAGGDADERRRVIRAFGARLGRADYQPPGHGDAIAHWIKYDSWRAPSHPHATFPQTREYGSIRPARTQPNTLDRHDRSATWFAVNRRGGSVILHHRHIRPVLIRDWSTPRDGIEATIWASRSMTESAPP